MFLFILKVADVSAVASIISLFHQRYVEFTPLFKKTFVKNFEGINCKDEEKVFFFLFIIFHKELLENIFSFSAEHLF